MQTPQQQQQQQQQQFHHPKQSLNFAPKSNSSGPPPGLEDDDDDDDDLGFDPFAEGQKLIAADILESDTRDERVQKNEEFSLIQISDTYFIHQILNTTKLIFI